jgi:pyridinium-3,5-bisthiocarboxylic acid mononucleotide nickel chelatase
MGKIAVIDCQISGISGDMLLSSLVDAGADKNRVIAAIFECQNHLEGCTISKVTFTKKLVSGFKATQLVLEYKDGTSARRGSEMYASLARCCDRIGLRARARVFALESMKKIIGAESKVHGEPFNNIFLRETSSIDTFADLIGCAVALEELDLLNSKVYSTRVAVGSGQFSFSHGVVPNPGNAIIEIFKGLPFSLQGTNVEEELTTPTGAAMLVTLCNNGIDYYPVIKPERTGYGAGHKCLKNVPNILRLLIGRSPISEEVTKSNVFVIETNIDDLSGEIVGNMIEELDRAGVLDVSVFQGLSKKNRPTYLVKIITDTKNLDNILDILFAESGTLGARVQEVNRIVMPRNLVTISLSINGKLFNIRVKIARNLRGVVINIKPEFEDIRNISRITGLPTKRILDLVRFETIQRFGET